MVYRMVLLYCNISTLLLSFVEMDIPLLIKLVKNFPHLYDTRHGDYTDFELKLRTWQKIAATMKVPSKLLLSASKIINVYEILTAITI